LAEAFKDSKTVVEEQIAEDDKVVTLLTWQAIHVAELQGMPPTGVTFKIKGITIDYFKDGMVIRHFPLFDTAQLFSRQVVRERVRTQIARDLHDNIGSTLGSISYYSEMAQQLLGEKQSQLKILLQKIEESSHELVEEMSDIVWAINPANNSFEKLTTRMKNYAGDLFAARNIDFSFETTGAPDSMLLSTERRKNIFLIFKEAVYNTAKHAHCSSFHASIRLLNETLVVELLDNGTGFDATQPKSYNGNGIVNMKHRAAEIGAEFSVISAEGNGTKIRFEVPMNKR
jgi:signal transduction histidine kinase